MEITVEKSRRAEEEEEEAGARGLGAGRGGSSRGGLCFARQCLWARLAAALPSAAMAAGWLDTRCVAG